MIPGVKGKSELINKACVGGLERVGNLSWGLSQPERGAGECKIEIQYFFLSAGFPGEWDANSRAQAVDVVECQEPGEEAVLTSSTAIRRKLCTGLSKNFPEMSRAPRRATDFPTRFQASSSSPLLARHGPSETLRADGVAKYEHGRTVSQAERTKKVLLPLRWD